MLTGVPADNDAKPPILFLHGVFSRPALSNRGSPALPGRDPIDDDVLARTGIQDCFHVALDAFDRLRRPAIVIGHSMGGLLTLLPRLPAILAGQPFFPSDTTMREVPLNTLPGAPRLPHWIVAEFALDRVGEALAPNDFQDAQREGSAARN